MFKNIVFFVMFSVVGICGTQSSFIQFIYPHVLQANAQIKQERGILLSLREQYEQAQRLSKQDLDWLLKLAKEYRVANFNPANRLSWEEMLKRVDIVPAPLAIAQAAKESGWGKSRFALEANNFFGQWCFTANCGIVPKRRSPNAKHEVKRFRSPYHSVHAYLRNLNSGEAYKQVRHLRAQMREEGRVIDGKVLALGLKKYSEQGHTYIREVQELISRHGLERYNS